MTDLTGITLRPAGPTTPAVTEFNARREAARQAREDEKRAYYARIRKLEQDARDSLTRPAKAATKRKPAAPKAPTVGRPETIAVCKGTCGRLTRPRGKQIPGRTDVVPRVREGKCSTCLTGGRTGGSGRRATEHPRLAEMIDLYNQGLSAQQVGERVGIASKSTILTHLHRAGVTLRDPVDYRKPGELHPDTPAMACLYKDGMSAKDIGTRFGISSKSVVLRNLRAAGVEIRDRGNQGAVDRLDVPAVKAAYLEGKPIAVLARENRVSANTIARHLKRAGVTIRTNTEALKGRTRDYDPELVEQVRRMYVDQQMTQTQIGRALGFKDYASVARILHRNNIPVRPGGRGNRAAA